jgi:hypothetical protein
MRRIKRPREGDKRIYKASIQIRLLWYNRLVNGTPHMNELISLRLAGTKSLFVVDTRLLYSVEKTDNRHLHPSSS